MDVNANPVPLAVFIAALRDQLKAAQALRDPDLPIEVGPVTVEFTVLTRKEGEGKAGIRFWVVDAGVGATRATESTQKVTLQLTPLNPAGGSLRVADEERRGTGDTHDGADPQGDIEPQRHEPR